jgi:hypothetical protein
MLSEQFGEGRSGPAQPHDGILREFLDEVMDLDAWRSVRATTCSTCIQDCGDDLVDDIRRLIRIASHIRPGGRGHADPCRVAQVH